MKKKKNDFMKHVFDLKRMLFLCAFGLHMVNSNASSLPVLETKSIVQIKVSGVVRDGNGIPIPGVNIMEKGTKNITVTDFDGKFQLSITTNNASLVVSYLGYKPQTITLGNKTSINVTLVEDAAVLDDIIVIGYGSVVKSDLTGSVSSVKAKDIAGSGFISLDQALAGKASGVIVTQSSGVPGAGASIRVRGIGSLNGTQPLYIIDGVQMDNTPTSSLNAESQEAGQISPLSSINPADIESIEILKDASSTAIYGSRGANGVVLITTKSGKEGKGIVRADFETGISTLPKYIDVLDANEYWSIKEIALRNNGSATTDSRIAQAKLGLLNSTFWQNTIIKPGYSQTANVQFSGGNKDIRYSASVGLLDMTGIIKKSDFKRVTTRVNLDADLNKKLSIGTRISYNIIDSHQANTTTNIESASGNNSVIQKAIFSSPSAGEDARYDPLDPTNEITNYSPLEALEANTYNNDITQLSGGMFLNYKIGKKLKFKTDVSFQDRNTDQYYYQLDILPGASSSRHGWAVIQNSNIKVFTNTNTLNYDDKFGENHTLNALLGQSIQNTESISNKTSNYGFANDLLTYYAPGTAKFQDYDQVGYSKTSLASFFGRMNYGYKNKILFTLTGRYDAASQFAANNKWGFFPAAAIAYKLDKEKFLKNSNTISEMKFRLSYGTSGNQSISPYQSLDQLGNDTTVLGTATGAEVVVPIYYQTQLPNDNLKWETTGQIDTGIDFGFFKNRISGTVDYFRKITNDLLISNNGVPAQSGFTSYTKNFGSLTTEGLEVALSARIIEGKKVNWTINGTFGTGKTKIRSLNDDYIQTGYSNGRVNNTQRLIIGDEVGTFYGFKQSGIAQFDDFVEFRGLSKQEQINKYYANPAFKNYTLATDFKGGLPGTTALNTPGAQLYQDTNGDGVLNDSDKQVIGRAQADYTFGINNAFTFGNIDFSFFIDGQQGNDIANMMNMSLLNFDGGQQSPVVKQAWTPENPSDQYPRLDAANGSNFIQFTDRYIEDGSFIRLQNVTLGYKLPFDVLSKLGIQSLRLYISGTNLAMITKYTGFNPDVSLTGTNVKSIGHDQGGYPISRMIRMGANLSF